MASTVTIQEGVRQTFKAASSWSPVATSATDVFSITGVDKRVIRVLRLKVSGVATASTVAAILVLLRSTANTAGTPTTVTNVCTDRGNGSLGKALVQTYTANPTTGTLVGNLEAERLHLSVAAGVDGMDTHVFDFTLPGTQPPTLRASTDVLALNLSSLSIAGIALSVTIDWTEEESM